MNIPAPLDKSIPHLTHVLTVLFLSSPTRSLLTPKETSAHIRFLTVLLDVHKKLLQDPKQRHLSRRAHPIFSHDYAEDILQLCEFKENVHDFEAHWSSFANDLVTRKNIQIIAKCLETLQRQVDAYADDLNAQKRKAKLDKEEKLRILNLAREDRERVARRSAFTPHKQPPPASVHVPLQIESSEESARKERMRAMRLATLSR